jgi:hypothetical protein
MIVQDLVDDDFISDSSFTFDCLGDTAHVLDKSTKSRNCAEAPE